MMKRFNEALTFCVIVVYYIFTVTCACGVDYSGNTEIDNKIGTKHLLNTFHAESLSVCAAGCLSDCSCYGYHRGMKQCRLHVICDVVHLVTEELGWRYYSVSQNGR
jgi:hypothetical protein